MLYSSELYTEKLLKELKLHDAEVIGLKLNDDYFQIDISCEGMDLKRYFENIDNVIISIKVYGVTKLEFDYLGRSIVIGEIDMIKNNNNVDITINKNDLNVIGNKYEILVKENRKYNEKNRNIDNFLKNY